MTSNPSTCEVGRLRVSNVYGRTLCLLRRSTIVEFKKKRRSVVLQCCSEDPNFRYAVSCQNLRYAVFL